MASYPVVSRPYDDPDPWQEWLSRELLTRNDGLWLSDGVDPIPLDVRINNVQEKVGDKLVLTGDRSKLLLLLGISNVIAEKIIVGGDWRSADGVNIRINSALVPARFSERFALSLSKEDPFQVWLPQLEVYEGGEECSRSQRSPCRPWLINPSYEVRLDEADPFAANSVIHRLQFGKEIITASQIASNDSFKRTWTGAKGNTSVRSEAWGRNPVHDEAGLTTARRLVCSSDFLRDVLAIKGEQLILYIMLRRYEKGHRSMESQYWHTIGVVRVTGELDFEFYPGVVNEVQAI